MLIPGEVRMRSDAMKCAGLATLALLLAACGPQDGNRKELDSLRVELDRLKAEIGKHDPEGHDPGVQDPQELAKRQQLVLRKIQADFERDFRGDEKPALAKELQMGFSALQEAKEVKVECKGDLCRLETRHDSAEAFHAFKAQALFGVKAIWQGPFTICNVDSAGGQGVRSLTYLGKKPSVRHIPLEEREPCDCAPAKAPKAQGKAG